MVAEPFLRRELSREDARAIVAGLRDGAGGAYEEAAIRMGMAHEHERLLDFVNRHALGASGRGSDDATA